MAGRTVSQTPAIADRAEETEGVLGQGAGPDTHPSGPRLPITLVFLPSAPRLGRVRSTDTGSGSVVLDPTRRQVSARSSAAPTSAAWAPALCCGRGSCRSHPKVLTAAPHCWPGRFSTENKAKQNGKPTATLSSPVAPARYRHLLLCLERSKTASHRPQCLPDQRNWGSRAPSRLQKQQLMLREMG